MPHHSLASFGSGRVAAIGGFFLRRRVAVRGAEYSVLGTSSFRSSSFLFWSGPLASRRDLTSAIPTLLRLRSPPPQARNVMHGRSNGRQPLRRILLPREHEHLVPLSAEARRARPRVPPCRGRRAARMAHRARAATTRPAGWPPRAASGTGSNRPGRAACRSGDSTATVTPSRLTTHACRPWSTSVSRTRSPFVSCARKSDARVGSSLRRTHCC